jgi:hypothetical protein
MGKSKNENAGDLNVQNLNEGVNYMKEEKTTVQENAAENQQIVNTEAVKAKANQVVDKSKEVAGKAKTFATDYVGKVKTDKKYMVITAVVAVIILVLLFGKLFMPGSGVVRSYWNGMKKADAEKMVKLYHEDTYEDEDDVEEEWEDRFDYLEDADIEYKSFKIVDCEVYSKDELEDLAEDLEDTYDIDEKDVKAARTYFVKVKYTTDGDKDLSYTSVDVVKIEGKWYLMD